MLRNGMKYVLGSWAVNHLYTGHFLSITTSFDEKLRLELWADVPYRV
jgi:hypothetical protein